MASIRIKDKRSEIAGVNSSMQLIELGLVSKYA